jgi:hypothetical protein
VRSSNTTTSDPLQIHWPTCSTQRTTSRTPKHRESLARLPRASTTRSAKQSSLLPCWATSTSYRKFFFPLKLLRCYSSALRTTHELTSLFGLQEARPESTSLPSLPSIEDDEEEDPSYTTSSSRKRPKRDAAISAARNIPRQPSPFELSPPLSRGSNGGAAAGASGSQSNREVSHSLIERRRRERINDCLAHLRQLVPQCREEGEKKVARAKERGRKRGRKAEDDGGEDGQRGGLHKLEILQVSASSAMASEFITHVRSSTGNDSLRRGAREPHRNS